jgi:hypothetical protein
MKRKTGYIALIFILLLLTALNQTACARDKAEEVEEAEKVEKVEKAEKAEEEESVSLMSEKYKEMNSLIDKIIFQKIIGVIQFFKKYILIVWALFLTWPPLIKKIIIISFIPACIGIISSHAIGIYQNRKRWEKHPYYDLMYSYFTKSGTLQRRESYSDAHALLRDRKWSWVSFAGLAYRLGNYDNASILLTFLFSFAYIPLSILGFIEMTFRIIFGTVWLIAFNLLQRIILFITRMITLLFIPVSNIIDNIIKKTQHCPHCYETFTLPEFVCPSCGRVHKKLIPGSCGVLFARCACNKVFLPCVSFTGRSFLDSKCPSCSGELYAANPKHFSITVMGGNNSGKAAFLSAFTHLYKSVIEQKRFLTIEGDPDNYFIELNDMFYSGIPSDDDESRIYSMIHKYGKMKTDNLVLYDTLPRYIISDSYPRSPKYFGYSDGIILLIDPLSVQRVQKDFKEEKGKEARDDPSDDTNQMIVQFIHQYNTICGFSTGLMIGIPVAVLINKVDVDIVKREIGMDAIKSLYRENPSAYKNNLNYARDQICRDYLIKIGLINVVNNIDAIFSNASFFPVSAAGHAQNEGKIFKPVGVMEPVAWIAKKGHSRLAGLLSSGVKYINNKG